MEDFSNLLSLTFLAALFASGIRLAIPIFYAALGEIITERGGVLNLGIEGIMLAGALGGFMGAYYFEQVASEELLWLAPWAGLAAGIIAGMALGLVMAVLAITLRTDQVVAGITLVFLGQAMTTYIFRQQFGELNARITGFEELHIPFLSDIPFFGRVFFSHDILTYLSIIILFISGYFLFRTVWGLNIRASGEQPAAADTSGVNVNVVRYVAVLIGAGLAGLGGAALTVQLGIFNEGITAGRGWIAVALVIFARWRPGLAFLGALLFGTATALQFRAQALNIAVIPYEVFLMMPYVLTILVLMAGVHKSDAPAALGTPYVKE